METTLNKKNEIIVKANAFINPLLPSAGLLAIGDQGTEFITNSGSGFIQIPWSNVELVKADVLFGGKYIRGFEIITDSNHSFSFVASDARSALKVMRTHLASDQMIKNTSNFKKIIKKMTSFRNFYIKK